MGNICGAPSRDKHDGESIDRRGSKSKTKVDKKGVAANDKSIPQAKMEFDNKKKEKEFSTADAFSKGDGKQAQQEAQANGASS